MSYHEYRRMIAELDGVEPPADDEELDAASIEKRDYKFDEEGDQWFGTLYLKDGEPMMMKFYIWSAEDENIIQHLSDDLGFSVGFGVVSGGNGHYTAEIVRLV